jgi:Derlin-2/3
MNNGRGPANLDDTNGPQQWYEQLPFVTRNWFTAAVLGTVLTNFSVIPGDKIYYSYQFVKDEFEIWRLFTNFFYMGSFQLGTLIQIYLLYQYSMNYESNSGFNTGGGGGTADYIFMLLFGMMGLLVTGTFFSLGAFYGSPLVNYVMYVWCKRDPTAQVSLWGFPIQAMYLPFALLILQVFIGNPYISTLQGYAIGHVYYFLAEVLPKVNATMVLHTPQFLISKFGVGEYVQPTPANGMDAVAGGGGGRPAAAANDTGGRHNWGGGGQALGR